MTPGAPFTAKRLKIIAQGFNLVLTLGGMLNESALKAPETASSSCGIIRSNQQYRFGRHFQGAFSNELTQGKPWAMMFYRFAVGPE
jgi:hypothetical protein